MLTSSKGLYSKRNSVRAGSHSYRLASFADSFARATSDNSLLEGYLHYGKDAFIVYTPN